MYRDDIVVSDTIEIKGLDAMVRFIRYRKDNQEVFLDGMELVENLKSKSGAILYAKGTKLSPMHIKRLIRLHESNPDIGIVIKINKSGKFIHRIHDEFKEKISDLFKQMKQTRVFRDLLSPVGEHLEFCIDEIFSDENIILSLYRVEILCEEAKTEKAILFFNHSLKVMLFSLAIALSTQYSKIVGKDKTKLVEICMVGMLHNYGALTEIDAILEGEEEKRFRLYWDRNRTENINQGNNQINSKIMDSIRFVCEYYIGKKGFIHKNEWQAVMANIVLVTEIFLQQVNGLFSKPKQVKKVVDQLNVLMAKKELNELTIQSLTIGLNLQDIFDFYLELDRLKKECSDNNAVPYPLTGFKSPTLFLCKNKACGCKYIETAFPAVNLIKTQIGLKPGKYHRCLLLSHKLNTFYKKHYDEIKENIISAEKPRDKKK